MREWTSWRIRKMDECVLVLSVDCAPRNCGVPLSTVQTTRKVASRERDGKRSEGLMLTKTAVGLIVFSFLFPAAVALAQASPPALAPSSTLASSSASSAPPASSSPSASPSAPAGCSEHAEGTVLCRETTGLQTVKNPPQMNRAAHDAAGDSQIAADTAEGGLEAGGKKIGDESGDRAFAAASGSRETPGVAAGDSQDAPSIPEEVGSVAAGSAQSGNAQAAALPETGGTPVVAVLYGSLTVSSLLVVWGMLLWSGR